MNKEAQLTTMMVLSAVLALSGCVLVYLTSTRGRPNEGAVCPPVSDATMVECRVRPAVKSPAVTQPCPTMRQTALWLRAQSIQNASTAISESTRGHDGSADRANAAIGDRLVAVRTEYPHFKPKWTAAAEQATKRAERSFETTAARAEAPDPGVSGDACDSATSHKGEG
jgi:hypothetical protein